MNKISYLCCGRQIPQGLRSVSNITTCPECYRKRKLIELEDRISNLEDWIYNPWKFWRRF